MTDDAHARAFHESPCGLVSTTPSGVILDVNDTFATWTGHEREQLVGRRFADLLDASSLLFFETRHAQVLHLQGHVEEVALTLLTAGGSALPVLVNSIVVEHAGERLVRTAVFSAAQRVAYERDLLQARRSAETSEARVRVLQDVSGTFGLSLNDQDVVDSFAQVAREAFAAADAAVMLLDDDGELQLAAGVNPLWGTVPVIAELRDTDRELVLTADDAETAYPELADGLRRARLEALSITPLAAEQTRLGLLVCFFGRRREFDDGFFDLQRALGRQAAQTLVRVRLQRRLEHLALYDQLTGVPNRQHVEQSLERAIDEAEESGRPLTVVFIDVDSFKSINDRHGHAAGDIVLRVLAERFRDGVRTGDIVGRIGGDEFIAICADADPESANVIAQRVLELAREPIDTVPVPLSMSVSIGLAVYRPGAEPRPTPDQMLIRADGAMYTSKDAGKDQVSMEQVQHDPRRAAFLDENG